MATKRNIPTDYQSAQNFLKGRAQRAIGKSGLVWRDNIYNQDDGEAIHLRLHNTNIVTWWPDGSTILRTGGWHTVTTQSWLKHALRGIPGMWVSRAGGIMTVGSGPGHSFSFQLTRPLCLKYNLEQGSYYFREDHEYPYAH